MTPDFVVNRNGEKFYVGDRVCFMGQEGHDDWTKVIVGIKDNGCWISQPFFSWMPDNLVLVERPGTVLEGWTL